MYDGVSVSKHVSQFAAEKKTIANTATTGHIRVPEIVSVIETALEETERASGRESV